MKHGLTILITAILVSCLSVSADDTRRWIAVGDDGVEGRATGYVMVASQDSALIVNSSNDTTGWDSTIIGLIYYGPNELPTPSDPGTLETFAMTGLPSGVWFASIKAFDEVMNFSPLGNICKFEIPDTISPAAILSLD